MTYLKEFYLPSVVMEERATNTPSSYPFGIFPYKQLEKIKFKPITIFYGNNGSGKSTLLNIIAEKLRIPRTSNFNTNALFKTYIELCRKISEIVPINSKFITSEDIISYILETRMRNSDIEEKRDWKKYILDEPENSLAPKLQMELSKIILECARYNEK